MAATQRGMHTVLSRPYKADAAIAQYDFVVLGSDAAHVKLPTGQGARALGVALQAATAAEQVIDVLRIGWVKIVDELGNLNAGDAVTTAATAYQKGVIATSGDYVVGYVEGDDATAAGDHVLIYFTGSDRIV